MDVAAREPRANAAFLRLPRSGNHHDLGLFGLGPTAPPKGRGGIGLYHLAWQVDTIDELERPGTCSRTRVRFTGESSHGATKSVYGADPDGNEFEVMWMLPREDWGEYENAAPIDRLDLGPRSHRWSGVRTAGQIVRDSAGRLVTRLPGTRGGDRRVDRPGGAAGRAAARPRLARAGDPRPRRPPAGRPRVRRGARPDRRGRRLRLVRQPRHRPPGRRVAARDDGLVPRLARRGRAGRAAGRAGRLQRRRGLRRRAAARRPGPLRRRARSSTARCRSTPASRPPRPGSPAYPSFVAQGEHDTVIPRELLDRTWDYLLGESGAPTIARRDPVGHGIARRGARDAGRLAVRSA